MCDESARPLGPMSVSNVRRPVGAGRVKSAVSDPVRTRRVHARNNAAPRCSRVMSRPRVTRAALLSATCQGHVVVLARVRSDQRRAVRPPKPSSVVDNWLRTAASSTIADIITTSHICGSAPFCPQHVPAHAPQFPRMVPAGRVTVATTFSVSFRPVCAQLSSCMYARRAGLLPRFHHALLPRLLRRFSRPLPSRAALAIRPCSLA